MTTEAFFDRPDAAALIEEARVAASMPVAVHEYDDVEERALLTGCGSCQVCRSASSTREGAAACDASRATAAQQAFNRNGTVPFVCHLGLSCVVAPLDQVTDVHSVITFGPFCPSEAPEGLDATVAEGLLNVGVEKTVSLNDVARVSANGVPILVDWTVDRIRALRQAFASSEITVDAPGDLDSAPHRPRPEKSRARISGPAPIIVVALAASDRAAARWYLRNALEEAAALPDGTVHARAISLVSQVLEAAEHARLPTTDAWNALKDLVVMHRQLADVAELSRACIRVLGCVLKNVDVQTTAQIAVVFSEVSEGYADGVLLEDVAAKIGTDPTAITHSLQRRFGLNFSELVGKIRIERAKRLLRNSQFGISEIARRVGVSDASNFGRLFRKFEGIAPLNYREQFRRAA